MLVDTCFQSVGMQSLEARRKHQWQGGAEREGGMRLWLHESTWRTPAIVCLSSYFAAGDHQA